VGFASKHIQACAPWGFKRTVINAAESVGAVLHEARLSKGHSLSDFSAALRIPERYLRALEEEDFSGLPGIVYEKHFVYRYAAALDLAPAPLIKKWLALRQNIPSATRFVARVQKRDLWVSPFFWRRLFSALAVLVVGVYLGGRLLGMLRPPSLTVIEPLAAMTTSERTVIVSGVTEAETKVMVNGEVVPTKQDGSFVVPMTLELGINTIRVVASKRYSRSAVVERQVFVATSSPLGGNQPDSSVVFRTPPR
jgi:hypothetical protein